MEKSIDSVPRIKERDFSFFKGLSISLMSFFLAVSPLFESLSPFPAAFLGTLSGTDCIWGFFGSIIGYISTGNFTHSIPYIAAMSVIFALRIIIGNKRTMLYNVISAAVSAVIIFIANLPSAQELSHIFTGFAFAIVTFVSVMALNTFFASEDKPFTNDNPVLLLSSGVTYTLLITAFTGLTADIFNAGIFISAAAIILAPCLRNGLTTPAGILSAAGIVIADRGFSEIAVILSLSSLVSSFFSRYGKITRACGLIFSLGAGVLVAGISQHSTICMASAFIGAVTAVIVPEQLIPTFRNRCCTAVSTAHKPFLAFGRRLEGMSIAIGEMNSAIRKTAQVLDNENLQDPSQIYISAAENICTGCKNNMYCWGNCYNRSADIMNKVISDIRRGILADETMLSGHFEEICTKRQELSAELNKSFAAFSSARIAARRVNEMRGVLYSQLSSTEKMLKKISEELCCENCFVPEAARTAERVLEENGIQKPSVSAIIIDGRLTIDAYGTDTPLFVPENIGKKLSFALRREFDPPMIAENGEGIHLTLSERSVYDAQIKTFSHSKGKNAYSGDYFDCFNDGKGNVYMILSDGMGSGSRARIDSVFSCSMLSKMLKAGIDFDAAMEMLNTSLAVKSSDESFATLDVCKINLYTGEISLYKAGSSSTYVRQGNNFSELSGNGIPFGVTVNAEYTENRFAVAMGDVVIMASDGAEIDRMWLEKIVMRERNPDLNSIITTIGEALRLSAEKGNEDDITVIGVKIIK